MIIDQVIKADFKPISNKCGQGTGVLACKWRNCGREFTEKKYLVDHVTSSHIEQRKGCDDFPCFWEVTINPSIPGMPT